MNEVANVDSRIESLLAIAERQAASSERQAAAIQELSGNVRGVTERLDRLESNTNEKFDKIDEMNMSRLCWGKGGSIGGELNK